MTEFKSSWWSLHIPAGWHAEKDEVSTTFSAEPENGALQISAVRNDNGPATDDDLLVFAKDHIEAGAKLKATACGAFTGFYLQYSEDDSFNREWWLRYRDTVVLVTYTCDLEVKGREDRVVDGILKTLKGT
jgi:hypothetical protein